MRPVDPDRHDADDARRRRVLRQLEHDGPHRRPRLRGRRGRDRQRRPHAARRRPTPSSSTTARRTSRSRRRSRSRAAQYQSYDAASKKLWLNATSPARSSSRANADDPHSGIASVTFPALLGIGHATRARRCRRTSTSPAPTRSARPPRRASKTITRRERRHRSRRRDEQRFDRRRGRRRRPGDEPDVPAQQRLATTTRPGTRAARPRGHLRHRRRRRLGRRAGERLDQGPHDGQVLGRHRLRPGVADVPRGEPRRQQLELRARPEQAHRAARLPRRALLGRQRRQRRDAPADPLHVRQRRRRADDHAVAHRRDATPILDGRPVRPLLRHGARRAAASRSTRPRPTRAASTRSRSRISPAPPASAARAAPPRTARTPIRSPSTRRPTRFTSARDDRAGPRERHLHRPRAATRATTRSPSCSTTRRRPAARSP